MREDLKKMRMLRELMWNNYLAPHQDPKKIIKSKEKFMPLENDEERQVSKISEEQKQVFLNEYIKWQQAVN